MKSKRFVIIFLIFQLSLFLSCKSSSERQGHKSEILHIDTVSEKSYFQDSVIAGAERYDAYEMFIRNKNVALVTNQSGIVGDQHLVDFLLGKGITLIKIFAPEHGIRGNIDRGKSVDDQKDEKTGIPIISLYGKNKKPYKSQLEDVDIVLFDIQDVGVRFFTYISTMHYVMEACAENGKQLVILDRPNPLGDYVDGPVLDMKYRSFVGMHPIPVVHGLTVGELAVMINEEGWLDQNLKCDLKVIKILNYDHTKSYSLPVKPSPNLPNDLSIRLYPSLCFFEATNISIGRGTEFPFQVIGYPDSSFGEFEFTPQDIPGMQMNPLQEGTKCFGKDLRKVDKKIKFSLKYVLEFSEKFKNSEQFITRIDFFNLLAGNDKLAKQIMSGADEESIRKSWVSDLNRYKILRKKYLLYKDFE
jgi:uncharacterized protein YbbC (DUF1343 family)